MNRRLCPWWVRDWERVSLLDHSCKIRRIGFLLSYRAHPPKGSLGSVNTDVTVPLNGMSRGAAWLLPAMNNARKGSKNNEEYFIIDSFFLGIGRRLLVQILNQLSLTIVSKRHKIQPLAAKTPKLAALPLEGDMTVKRYRKAGISKEPGSQDSSFCESAWRNQDRLCERCFVRKSMPHETSQLLRGGGRFFAGYRQPGVSERGQAL